MGLMLYTGVPGSGKSYLAVKTIVEGLEKKPNELFLVELGGKLNIENERLRYFPDTIRADYFRKDNMESVLTKFFDTFPDVDHITIVIDEAQRFFSPRLRDDAVFLFFDTHRHYHCDVILITQDNKKIHKELFCHCIEEIRAVNPLLQFGNRFIYKRYISGEQSGFLKLKKEKKYFELYSSTNYDSVVVPKVKVIRWPVYMLLLCGVFVVVGIFLHKKVMSDSFQNDSKPVTSSGDVKVPLSSSKKLPTQVTNIGNLPNIIRFRDEKVYFDDGVVSTFENFLIGYPPSVYGYSYFKSGRNLVIIQDNAIIYPIHRQLPVIEAPQEQAKKIF